MDKIYVTELDKPPLDEDTLAHYGVMGMKWGIRKNPDKAVQKASKKSDKYAKKIYKTNKKYLKEAKRVSRFFGRKKAQQKVVRLKAKVDYLTSKKEKWDNKVEKTFSKEKDRIQFDSKLTNEERKNKLSDLKLASDYRKLSKQDQKIYTRARMDVKKNNRWANQPYQPSSFRASLAAGGWAANPTERNAKKLEKLNDRDAVRYKAAQDYKKKKKKYLKEAKRNNPSK